MHHTQGLTLSVRNLPPETTTQDVQGIFNAMVPGSQPFVGSLVREPDGDTQCATVTLNGEDACKKACEKLNGYAFRAPRGRGSYAIWVEGKFLGITPLAEHDQPDFDYYFVHGLGGHPFETFAAPIQKHKHAEQKMWARDLLPEKLNKAGLHGRFSTLGYNANVVGGAGATTIDSAARDLLQQLQLDRPKDCQRPIFFVAHSLGGLVICRALILALDKDEQASADTNRLALDGLVKGVIFMGTPFWGSLNASTLTPFVSALDRVNPFPVNVGLVKTLKANSTDLASLVSHFAQVRMEHNIEIKIFYENLPLTTGMVTKPDSAAGPLHEFVDPLSINANHVGMVKFGNSADPKFRNVGEYLLRLTQKHIGGGGFVKSSTFATRPPSYSSASRPAQASTGYSRNGARAHSDEVQTIHSSPTRMSTTYTETQWPPASSTRAQTISPKRLNTAQHGNHYSSGNRNSQYKPSFQLPYRQSPPSVGPSVLAMPEQSSVSGPENARNLSRLADWDIVFVIDDTNSMDLAADSVAASKTDQRVTTRWDVLVRAMQYIAAVAAKYDEDGVDVYFLCSSVLNELNVRDGQRVLDLLSQVDLERNTGGTYLEKALSPILQSFMVKYKKYHRAISDGEPAEPPKPTNIIVITDGKADDGKVTENLIVRVAKELDDMWAPTFQLGIQFVQVGDDEAATKFLKLLDDRLEKKHQIRDMVDTRHFIYTETGKSLGDRLLKILLAAMDKALDNDNDTLEEAEEEDDPYS